MRHAFLTDLDGMEEFFRRVVERKANTEEERLEIMAELVRERQAEYVGDTNLSNKSVAAKLRNYGVKAKVYPEDSTGDIEQASNK